MLSIRELAYAAVREFAKADKGMGWGLAVILAIKGKGVTNQQDINRLRPLVLDEIDRQRKCTDFPPSVLQAAQAFNGWVRQQKRTAKERGTKYTVDYKRLTGYVYLFIESQYAKVPWRDRPNVFEVETYLRSLNAKKASKTRKKNKERQVRQAPKLAKKRYEAEQQERQLRLL